MPKAKKSSKKSAVKAQKKEVVQETAPAAPATQAVAPATPALQEQFAALLAVDSTSQSANNCHYSSKSIVKTC